MVRAVSGKNLLKKDYQNNLSVLSQIPVGKAQLVIINWPEESGVVGGGFMNGLLIPFLAVETQF